MDIQVAMANSKGVIVDTWRVMVHKTVNWFHDKVQNFCSTFSCSDATTCTNKNEDDWEPFHGSLTGIANTYHKQNGAVYACGIFVETELF